MWMQMCMELFINGETCRRKENGQISNANIVKYIPWHYCDVIMSAMASQITSLTIVYSTVYSCSDQRKHQSSASLAFVGGNSPVTGEFSAQRASNAEMFPLDDVIMHYAHDSRFVMVCCDLVPVVRIYPYSSELGHWLCMEQSHGCPSAMKQPWKVWVN